MKRLPASKDVPPAAVLIRTDSLRGTRATAEVSFEVVRQNPRKQWSETQCQH